MLITTLYLPMDILGSPDSMGGITIKKQHLLIKWLIFDILKLAKGGVDMITAIATATEMQNNFGRYLNLVMSGQEIVVTKNGREVGRFVPKDTAVSYLTDSLTGILKGNYDLEEAKAERLKEKYEAID